MKSIYRSVGRRKASRARAAWRRSRCRPRRGGGGVRAGSVGVLRGLGVFSLQVWFEDAPPYVERVVFVSESITPGEGAVSAHRCDQFILVNKPGCEDRSATRDVNRRFFIRERHRLFGWKAESA